MLREFQNEHYYHICNRGVDKRDVFMDDKDYVRFLESIRYFNQIKPIGSLYRLRKTFEVSQRPRRSSAPLINVIAYCLNRNHYHLLVKQVTDKGISSFMSKLGNGYTKYFNEKYKRSGCLFQGKFKSREIKSSYDLLKMSVYVNCNSEIHNISKKENWQWSSYKEYVTSRGPTVSDTVGPHNKNKKEVLENFNNTEEYKNFCEELIPDIKKIKNLEKYNLE